MVFYIIVDKFIIVVAVVEVGVVSAAVDDVTAVAAVVVPSWRCQGCLL